MTLLLLISKGRLVPESAISSFRKPRFMDSRFVFEKQSLKNWTHSDLTCRPGMDPLGSIAVRASASNRRALVNKGIKAICQSRSPAWMA
jgi:hypothetical protein